MYVYPSIPLFGEQVKVALQLISVQDLSYQITVGKIPGEGIRLCNRFISHSEEKKKRGKIITDRLAVKFRYKYIRLSKDRAR